MSARMPGKACTSQAPAFWRLAPWRSYGKHILAVMLTGLGRDGTKEFTDIKKAGGWTIAQDSASCTVFGMPKSLIEAGGACETLPPKSIAHRIEEILARRR